MKSKFDEIAQAIGRCIQAGDYNGAGVPGERGLAVQFGVSHMTARKAVEKLVREGVLSRKTNGRLDIGRSQKKAARHLAFLAPAYYSSVLERMRAALERVAIRHQFSVRPVDFVHWDDPAIPEALHSFDGIFLASSAMPVPERVRELLTNRAAKPVVSLEVDLSASGIPSFCFFPAQAVERMLEYLWSLGHRRIDCLNTQPEDEVIRARIACWRSWCEARGARGHLINEPVKPYGHAIRQAHEVTVRLLRRKFEFSSAVIVTTGAGFGAMRALLDHGVRVGKDVSICAINAGEVAQYSSPSLTSLEPPAFAPYFERAIEWIVRGGQWRGPLCVEAVEAPLFKGESTGAPGK